MANPGKPVHYNDGALPQSSWPSLNLPGLGRCHPRTVATMGALHVARFLRELQGREVLQVGGKLLQ